MSSKYHLHPIFLSTISFLLLYYNFKVVHCFLSFSNHHQKNFFQPKTITTTSKTTSLFGGIGTTANYTWKEDQFEIEIKIPVPIETKTKHVTYKPKSKSIELYIEIDENNNNSNNNNEKQILLYGDRIFRGMIDLDGTFWSLHDVEDNSSSSSSGSSSSSRNHRELVVSIEKLIVPPNDPFAVVDYDWGSVYMNDENEILTKDYDEPEELDIKEYASSLGVDIDNINMTLVDKNMFSSGLNMTRNTLDELTKSGYVKEVTRQGDGMEFIEEGNGNDKKTVAFKSLGDNIGDDEIEDATRIGTSTRQPSIPFLDTNSPWRKSMPVEEARGVDGNIESTSSVGGGETDDEKDDESSSSSKVLDPVDRLTVSKLKEILKKEGLKVSGNKQELQDRLKNHVDSILQQQKNTNDDELDDPSKESFQ